MDYTFFLDWGYWGMAVAAFIAGSFIPFSSEAVMVALLAAGLDPIRICVYATVGNSVGSMVNYAVGSLGRTEWFTFVLHVPEARVRQAERFVGGRGAMMGFFCFLPVLGSAIAIVLGVLRSHPWLTALSVTVGKFLRYVAVIGLCDVAQSVF